MFKIHLTTNNIALLDIFIGIMTNEKEGHISFSSQSLKMANYLNLHIDFL